MAKAKTRAKPRTGSIEVYEDKAGEWRWRAKGANGEIVAQGEGFAGGPSKVRLAIARAGLILQTSPVTVIGAPKQMFVRVSKP